MSTLLHITSLKKTYGSRVIFDDATVTIAEKQKIGVTGRNGAGKSTLFRMIVGEEECDSGEILIHKRTHIAYLEQNDVFELDETVLSFLQRYTKKPEWQCAKVAAQFQLTNDWLTKKISDLSGGYRMRVKLAAMLIPEPNLLMLDEPTNYLDLSTLLLLEEFLKGFNGAYVVISHDREFLKRTCDHTLEVDQGKLTLFPQPLETYLHFKEQRIASQEKFNKQVEQKQQKLERFVERFRAKASKASQAQSKLKQLEKLQKVEITEPLASAHIMIPQIPKKPGFAMRIESLEIGYPEKSVAKNIDIDIKKGEHLAVVGDNGQGKTTLFKTIAGELDVRSGAARLMPGMRIAYYAQHVPQEVLRSTDTVYSYLERVAGRGVMREDILRVASNFLFQEDDLLKKTTVLSGGERARLCLAGMLLEKCDILLLDEPNNHLDFETVESLASALNTYNGTILFISHDRAFVEKVASGIIEVRDGAVTRHEYGYKSYVQLLRKEVETSLASIPKEHSTEPEASVDDATLSQKERRVLKKDLRTLERKIEKILEEKKVLLDFFAENPGVYSKEKTLRLKEIENQKDELEFEWVHLSAQLEQ